MSKVPQNASQVHGLQVLLFPFQVHGQTSSCTSNRANEAWFSVDLCPVSAQSCLTPMNNHHSPSMMSSEIFTHKGTDWQTNGQCSSIRLVPLGNRNILLHWVRSAVSRHSLPYKPTHTGAAGGALAYNSFFYLSMEAVCFRHCSIWLRWLQHELIAK